MSTQMENKNQSLSERILGIARPNLRFHDKITTARGFFPERAREIIEDARRDKYTLKSNVFAVGPHFDDGMNNLDEYSKIVEKFEHKHLTDDLNQSWTKSFLAMCDTGFWDVAAAVGSAKPSTVDHTNANADKTIHAFGTSRSEVIKKEKDTSD